MGKFKLQSYLQVRPYRPPEANDPVTFLLKVSQINGWPTQNGPFQRLAERHCPAVELALIQALIQVFQRFWVLFQRRGWRPPFQQRSTAINDMVRISDIMGHPSYGILKNWINNVCKFKEAIIQEQAWFAANHWDRSGTRKQERGGTMAKRVQPWQKTLASALDPSCFQQRVVRKSFLQLPQSPKGGNIFVHFGTFLYGPIALTIPALLYEGSDFLQRIQGFLASSQYMLHGVRRGDSTREASGRTRITDVARHPDAAFLGNDGYCRRKIDIKFSLYLTNANMPLQCAKNALKCCPPFGDVVTRRSGKGKTQ
ncbi:hypothetical protein BKA70DRAFT_1494930 [Coprinopsis sp. MPI-PUGE-AT-0042]|nr:hypothetical protein BKA70DRAFT_1494930 [Coprinopsis sp. MPI-PUGE-AT-0042]